MKFLSAYLSEVTLLRLLILHTLYFLIQERTISVFVCVCVCVCVCVEHCSDVLLNLLCRMLITGLMHYHHAGM